MDQKDTKTRTVWHKQMEQIRTSYTIQTTHNYTYGHIHPYALKPFPVGQHISQSTTCSNHTVFGGLHWGLHLFSCSIVVFVHTRQVIIHRLSLPFLSQLHMFVGSIQFHRFVELVGATKGLEGACPSSGNGIDWWRGVGGWAGIMFRHRCLMLRCGLLTWTYMCNLAISSSNDPFEPMQNTKCPTFF